MLLAGRQMTCRIRKSLATMTYPYLGTSVVAGASEVGHLWKRVACVGCLLV